MDRLVVKNFGPLKDIDIEINKINLFIGENGSGKSVLGKLLTILTNLEVMKEENFFQKLNEFQINYIESKTLIRLFLSGEENTYIRFRKNKLDIGKNIKEFLIELDKNNKFLDNKNFFKSLENILNTDELLKFNKESKERSSNNFIYNKITKSQYIPAERNLISLFNKYVTTFITADIPLPKFLLNFSSQYVRAREEINELSLLNMQYKFENDSERIYYNEKDSLLLEQSSSGIQSALPLYLTVKYFVKKHKSIIIEEPEQNLFPKAQKETVQYIIEQVSDNNHLFMMTHSPYVLSTLNNLIFAHKVAQMSKKTKEQVKELVKEEQWINPDDFSAYYLENGVARSIKSSRGLISDNEIDDISEEMGDEFNTLMEIYREFKYAK